MSAELEKRIQRMEEDLSILKNQIRNTLLDIQEQLAANYHPSLRASRSAATRTPGASPDGSEEQAGPPKVKQVSLDESRAAGGAGANRDVSVGVGLLTSLMKWARNSVAAIGPLHTRQVLEAYATDGQLSEQLVERVVSLTALSSAEPPDEDPSPESVLEMFVSLGEALASTSSSSAGGQEQRRG